MKNQLIYLFLFCTTIVCGQDNTILTSGALRANFGSGGALYAPDGGSFLSLEVDGEYVPLMFEAGFVFGGLDPGSNLNLHDLRGSSNTPGIIGNTDPIVGPWRVTAEEIANHQADFADNGVIDNPIASVFAWPGRGNLFFEEYNGVIIDPSQASVGPFWDIDFDGQYDPDAGEYPILEIRGCLESPVVVSEMIFFPIMSTSSASGEPTVQVYLTAFRVGCEEVDSPINNAVFLKYKIINRNIERRDDFHFGFFADGDIGCPFDDYVGTFPERFATYFYNADATDDGCIVPQNSYGDNPPVLGIDVFRLGLKEDGNALLLNSTMPIYNAASGAFPAATLDYDTPLEGYNYLQGQWRDGSPLLDEAIGYISGDPTNFAFGGDPLSGDGWSEAAANNPSGDRRVMLSSEVFTHFPGAVNEFVLGFTYNDDPNANNLGKISGLRDNLDQIQALFDNCFTVNELNAELLGCSPIMTDLMEVAPDSPKLNIYPNPADGLLQIEASLQGKANLRVFQANGQLLLQKDVENGSCQLDVAAWPKGLYLLQWRSEAGTATEKVVVQ